MLRAFEGTDPEKVRRHIDGQDPYPQIRPGRPAAPLNRVISWNGRINHRRSPIVSAGSYKPSWSRGRALNATQQATVHGASWPRMPTAGCFTWRRPAGYLTAGTGRGVVPEYQSDNQRSRAGRRAEKMPPPLPALGAVSSPGARIPRGQAIGAYSLPSVGAARRRRFRAVPGQDRGGSGRNLGRRLSAVRHFHPAAINRRGASLSVRPESVLGAATSCSRAWVLVLYPGNSFPIRYPR